MANQRKPIKLTKSVVERLEPAPSPYFVWDTDTKGFGVKVTPAARKVFVIQCRVGGVGSSIRKSIGPFGSMSVQQARQDAIEMLHEARKGVDPRAELKAIVETPTVSEALDRFFIDHVVRRLKPSTVENYRLVRRVHLEKTFGKLKLTDVTRASIWKFHAAMHNKPCTANKCLAILSKFFNWCEKAELLPQGCNPCKHIEKYEEKPRERFLDAGEIARLVSVLDNAERESIANASAVNAIRVLMMTGARRDEVLTLKWDYVDLQLGLINLPGSKTGKKTISLGEPAVQFLRSMERTSNPFVFPGKKPGSRLINLKSSWSRIRSIAGLQDVRLHDLRHTFASVAVNGGVLLEQISKLLGHKQLRTTQRYAHLQQETLKRSASAVAEAMSS